MDSTPSRSGTGLAVITLLLILAPGVGAVLGTMLHSEQFTVANLVLSPASLSLPHLQTTENPPKAKLG